MESSQRIWQLIAKVLNQEASSLEQNELSQLLKHNSDLQQQYELLTRIWKEKESHQNDEEDAKRHIAKIITRAESEPVSDELMTYTRRRRRRRLITGSILSLLIICAGAWFLNNSFSQTLAPAAELEQEALVAKNGSRTRSSLPDGTTVWLNAGSKLFLESDFTGNTREVRLEGEAYFDVIKKPQQPFIVHTSGIDIKVLGTAFNVKAYPEDKTVETTLLRGIVQVFDLQDGRRDPIQLKPNQKLVLPKRETVLANADNSGEQPAINKAVSGFTITAIDSTKKENERIETAWVYSRLEFRGDRFEELARKMERWYNVKIIFSDESVKQLSFNGSFEKETIEQAFTALKEAKHFTYKINKHEIYIGSE